MNGTGYELGLQIMLLLTNFVAAYKFSVCIFAAYKFRETLCATELLQWFVESKWINAENYAHYVILQGGALSP